MKDHSRFIGYNLTMLSIQPRLHHAFRFRTI